ncbi:MAG: hypothetical protein ACFFBR_00145 [Promethearchaeota archaeon]
MSTQERPKDSIDFDEKEPSRRRKAMGCCVILIIIIFVIALFVGYSTWFVPVLP